MQSASDTPSSHASQGRAQPDRAPRAHVVAQRGPERGEPGPKQVVAKERVRPAAGAPGRIHERHATLLSAGGDSFRAAVESFRAKLDPSRLGDPEGAGAYPILALSWLVMRSGGDDAKSQAMRDVLRYALTDGQAEASTLGYIPLSEEAAALILQQLGPAE
jgi:hypothetical protein